MSKKHMKCMVIAAIVLVVSTFAVPFGSQGASASAFSGGNGTSASPFIISSVSDLEEISSLEYLGEGMNFVLSRDIDLTESLSQTADGWKPIGGKDNPFNGNFDGAGHTISGLWAVGNDDNVGLFSVIGEKGSVKNLSVVIDNSDGKGIIGSGNIGGIAGSLSGSAVSCNVSAVQETQNAVIAKTNAAGGIAGRMQNALISGCSSDANIKAQAYAGGLVGYQQSSGDGSECVIRNSYSAGSITTEVEPHRAGGIVGAMQDNCRVEYCYATGPVNSQPADGREIGGIAGANANVSVDAFASCYYDIQTTGLSFGVASSVHPGITGKTTLEMSDASTYVDWDFDIVWMMPEDVQLGQLPRLRKNSFSGGNGSAEFPYIITNAEQLDKLRDFTGSSNADTYFKLGNNIDLNKYLSQDGAGFSKWGDSGWLPIGTKEDEFSADFDGGNYTIKNLYINRGTDDYVGLFGVVGESGSVKSLTVQTAPGGIKGNSYVGVVAGYLRGSVEGCASVPGSLSNMGAFANFGFAGGLVGCIDNGHVINSYSKMDVTAETVGGITGYMTGENAGILNCRTSGKLTSSASSGYAGGIAGEVYNGRMSNCFSEAVVSASEEGRIGAFTGSSSEVNNSYFDAFRNSSLAWQDGAVDREHLNSAESYPGFDFDDTWVMNGISGPRLKWESVIEKGSGTNSDPYIISTAEQLVYLSNFLGEDYSNKHFKIDSDIDLSELLEGSSSGWKPIGDSELYFQGKLNGAGYVVSGLRINMPELSYIGLFSYLGSMSEITNLNVVIDNISNDEGIIGKNNVGAISGFSSGKIINCNVSAVSGEKYAVTAQNTAGGLTGYLGGVAAEIKASGSMVSVSVAENTAGSLAGIVTYGAVVSESFAAGNVRTGGSRAGGLAGWLYEGRIVDSFALGSVQGGSQSGGLVGHMQNNSSVESSYSAGNVAGQMAGALVGEVADDCGISMCYYIESDSGLSAVGSGEGIDEESGDGIISMLISEGAVKSNYPHLSQEKWDLVDSKTLPYLKWQYANLIDHKDDEAIVYVLEGMIEQQNMNSFKITNSGIAVLLNEKIVRLPDECSVEYIIHGGTLELTLSDVYPHAELSYMTGDVVKTVEFTRDKLIIEVGGDDVSIIDLVVSDGYGNRARAIYPQFISNNDYISNDEVVAEELDGAQEAQLSDVHTHWARYAIEYVLARNLISTASDTAFSPDMPMTRAALVDALYKLEGEPTDEYNTINSSDYFSDVSEDLHISNAISWAAYSGLILGMGDGTFSPDGAITREQIAQVLYRYAMYKGLDLTIEENLSKYSDIGQISIGAKNALAWSVRNGLIIGRTDDTLAPAEVATRAEVSTILYRMANNHGTEVIT